MRAKVSEQRAARALRQAGWSCKRIAAELGVSVSSAYAWTQGIELTADQRLQIMRGPFGPQRPELIARRAAARSTQARTKRLEYQEDGRRRAREGAPLHRDGCMLYWAEGSKDRNSVKFSNSDIDMSAMFCRFLQEAMGIPAADIQLRLNVYTNNGLTITEIENHWVDAIGLPRSCLRKHMLNHRPTSSSGKSRRRLIYGVGTLSVMRTSAVQHIYGAIQEYAGVERPEWLDARVRTQAERIAVS